MALTISCRIYTTPVDSTHRRQRSRRLAVFHEWFESLLQPHLER